MKTKTKKNIKKVKMKPTMMMKKNYLSCGTIHMIAFRTLSSSKVPLNENQQFLQFDGYRLMRRKSQHEAVESSDDRRPLG